MLGSNTRTASDLDLKSANVLRDVSTDQKMLACSPAGQISRGQGGCAGAAQEQKNEDFKLEKMSSLVTGTQRRVARLTAKRVEKFER